VFEDRRGALVVIRNDDSLIDLPANTGKEALTDENGVGCADVSGGEKRAGKVTNAGPVTVAEDMLALFSRTDGSPEREMPLNTFNTIFADDAGMSIAELRATLACEDRVWTWTRLRVKAEKAGMTAKSAASALGLAGGGTSPVDA
jgi:hypothetical protein